jgi:hypothetical protein
VLPLNFIEKALEVNHSFSTHASNSSYVVVDSSVQDNVRILPLGYRVYTIDSVNGDSSDLCGGNETPCKSLHEVMLRATPRYLMQMHCKSVDVSEVDISVDDLQVRMFQEWFDAFPSLLQDKNMEYFLVRVTSGFASLEQGKIIHSLSAYESALPFLVTDGGTMQLLSITLMPKDTAPSPSDYISPLFTLHSGSLILRDGEIRSFGFVDSALIFVYSNVCYLLLFFFCYPSFSLLLFPVDIEPQPLHRRHRILQSQPHIRRPGYPP